jgi:hypothetical protein
MGLLERPWLLSMDEDEVSRTSTHVHKGRYLEFEVTEDSTREQGVLLRPASMLLILSNFSKTNSRFNYGLFRRQDSSFSLRVYITKYEYLVPPALLVSQQVRTCLRFCGCTTLNFVFIRNQVNPGIEGDSQIHRRRYRNITLQTLYRKAKLTSSRRNTTDKYSQLLLSHHGNKYGLYAGIST